MDGYITIGTELDTKSFDKQILELERKANDLEVMLSKKKEIGLSSKEIAEVEVELEKTKNKLIQLNKEKEKLNKSGGLDNFGKSIEGSIKKVSRLILGIFGIRSAYMALRRASSDLAGYDDQYAANIEYIRYALTQAIAPVLRGIVQMAMQLLQYINMIVNALFGVNLFSKGSAESFQKMKAGAGAVGKAVKEIKKQLTGFDEINMLTAESDTGTSAGAGGVTAPSMDLSALGGEPPEWIKWLADNKDILLALIAGLVAGITAIKFGLDGITALGIGLLISGIVFAVQALISYINNPSWGNFGKVIQGIGVAIAGLGVIIAETPVIVAGAIVLILGTIIKYWDEIKGFLQGGIDWLVGKTDWVRDHFGIIGETIYKIFTTLLQGVLNIFDGLFTGLRGIFDGLIKFVTGVFTGDWKKAWEGIKQIFVSVFNTIKSVFMSVFNAIKNVVFTVGKTVGDIISGAFKGIVNGVLWAIENILNTPIKAINSMIGTINDIPGINIKKLNTFNLPRLKVGGIVNMPNKGTMIGGAIAGEAGAEGVIPLTDQQAMETLGEAIGRYITINANIVNKMNGRTLSREMVQIKNQQDFAYNL